MLLHPYTLLHGWQVQAPVKPPYPGADGRPVSYSTVGLPLQAALAASGRFDRVELRRGRRWNEWSLLVTAGGVESELVFVGWRLRPATERTPEEDHGAPGLHLRLVPRQPD